MKTQLTRTGQPVLGTTLLLEAEDVDGQSVGWLPAKVVGKLMGKGGSADLVGIVIEWSDGGRQPVPWADLEWRQVGDNHHA